MDQAEAARFLEELSPEEFVLHGSPYRLMTLEPRQANCGSGAADNNHLGVYASILVEHALLRALVRSDGEHDWGWKHDDDGDQQIILVTGSNLSLEAGYVYVLARERFTLLENGLWFISTAVVTPLRTVEVTPEILQYFEGIFFPADITVR